MKTTKEDRMAEPNAAGPAISAPTEGMIKIPGGVVEKGPWKGMHAATFHIDQQNMTSDQAGKIGNQIWHAWNKLQIITQSQWIPNLPINAVLSAIPTLGYMLAYREYQAPGPKELCEFLGKHLPTPAEVYLAAERSQQFRDSVTDPSSIQSAIYYCPGNSSKRLMCGSRREISDEIWAFIVGNYYLCGPYPTYYKKTKDSPPFDCSPHLYPYYGGLRCALPQDSE
jgi:hypothetical protein